MNTQWRDEILRRAMSGQRITADEVVDFLGQMIAPDTTRNKSGFDGFVDSPGSTTATRSTDRMASSRFTQSVEFFTCPSCKQDVTGQVTFQTTASKTELNKLSNEAVFSAKIIGVDVRHNCVPKVTR